jgi:hypothetical protein
MPRANLDLTEPRILRACPCNKSQKFFAIADKASQHPAIFFEPTDESGERNRTFYRSQFCTSPAQRMVSP